MENAKNGGISVIGLLGVVFVTLKLTGYINWSWWWVTLPFWGWIVLATIVFVVIIFFTILKTILKAILK